MTWAFKLVGMHQELVLRRLCIMKMFLGGRKRFRAHELFLTADDVLVSVVTGQIVSEHAVTVQCRKF